MFSAHRFVFLAIVGAALLLALTLSRFFGWCWEELGWLDPLPFGLRELPASTLIAYALAAGFGWALWQNRKARDFITEVVDELGQVTWPTRSETGRATMVVMASVVVSSAYLGVFDALWLWLTSALLQAGA